MTLRRKILIYDDSPVYGGHEVMAAYGVEALAASDVLRPVFMVSRHNRKLLTRLEEIRDATDNLEILAIETTSRKLQGVRNRWESSRIQVVASAFANQEPSAVLAIQGDIELSSMGVIAANRAEIKAISYIPVPHRLALMGAKLGAIRDLFNAYLFKRPDVFITISESMKALLRERGTRCPIEVVFNGIDTSRFTQEEPSAVRGDFGLPADKRILGMIGRVEYNQKQQDFMVRTFAGHRDRFPNVHLAIVGDGPDHGNLQALVEETGVSADVTLIPWTDEPSRLYSAFDVLMLPSRFEGVPLVMLEALCCGTPVLASNRDGMAEVLPEEWLFEPENPEALVKTYEGLEESRTRELAGEMKRRVETEMTLDVFKKNFADTVIRLLP